MHGVGSDSSSCTRIAGILVCVCSHCVYTNAFMSLTFLYSLLSSHRHGEYAHRLSVRWSSVLGSFMYPTTLLILACFFIHASVRVVSALPYLRFPALVGRHRSRVLCHSNTWSTPIFSMSLSVLSIRNNRWFSHACFSVTLLISDINRMRTEIPRLRSRFLVIQRSVDRPDQYVKVMNAIFSAQKLVSCHREQGCLSVSACFL